MDIHWDETVDVVVVGCGGAGSVAAITAREEGASVLVIEKQSKESQIAGTSTALSGGGLFLPQEGAEKYLEALWKIPTGLSWTEPDIIRVYVEYGSRAKDWIEERGGHVALHPRGGEHPELPAADAFGHYLFNGSGLGLQRFLNNTMEAKGIPVSFDTRATRLITDEKGRVVGVEAEKKGAGRKKIKIGAAKGVVLASGGFQFNETMKLNYLPVHPTHFTGSTSATGDGIRMAMAIGADLWHMNCVAGRIVVKYPEVPQSFSISFDSTRVRGAAKIEPGKRPGYVVVDRQGLRFSNEDFKHHAIY